MLTTQDFDFPLDPACIAQRPCTPRDASRLLVFPRRRENDAATAGTQATPPAAVEHRIFRDLVDLLRRGDTLVLNRSRVIPARLFGTRIPSGGKVEILLVRPLATPPASPTPTLTPAATAACCRWNCLMHARAPFHPGDRIRLAGPDSTTTAPAITATLIERHGLEGDTVEFDLPADRFETWFRTVGHLPLPPYICRGERRVDAHAHVQAQDAQLDRASAPVEEIDGADRSEQENAALNALDAERYQTVYAREDGSVAAPTAGLHFTPELLDRLRARGVRIAELILHVGPGTFRPVKADALGDHVMHEEHFEIPSACTAAIAAARDTPGARVIAVGTTTLRALESATPDGATVPSVGAAATRLFVHPPYRFRCVDGLITNFHLPRSTLFMLVSAFAAPGSAAGLPALKAAYALAQAKGYRFFSYGDAMLLV
ncbi:MAG: S-adenosylmethionine:tRNA ribosyltransferase-isomerase [Planctomycetota bacterium]